MAGSQYEYQCKNCGKRTLYAEHEPSDSRGVSHEDIQRDATCVAPCQGCGEPNPFTDERGNLLQKSFLGEVQHM